ncbi:MAG: MmcQ/YjbR family DNA-binding protein [Lachnospiraceae bacterium]|nr:MmcQ/YjbR family DNA-binding protein [Lachnospiraceae bacterium]
MDIKVEVFKYIEKKYKAKPEYLWRRFPNYAIFRHSDNKKWFSLIMDVEKEKLGLVGKSKVYILNIKMDGVEFRDALIGKKGYFKGYHISRGNWVTVLLDGTVNVKEIYNLIDISFLATASKKVKEENRKH